MSIWLFDLHLTDYVQLDNTKPPFPPVTLHAELPIPTIPPYENFRNISDWLYLKSKSKDGVLVRRYAPGAKRVQSFGQSSLLRNLTL